MKIVTIFVPLATIGGGESLLLSLSAFFRTRGVEQKFILLTNSEIFEKKLTENHIDYETVGDNKLTTTPGKKDYFSLFFRLIPKILKVRRLIISENPDVVITHGFPLSLIGSMVSDLLLGKYKFLYVHHALKNKERGIVADVYSSLLGRYSKIVGVSDGVRKSLVDAFPNLKDKIISIPNTVNVERFISNCSKDDLRRKLNLPSGIIGVNISRFIPSKNHKLIVSLCKEIKADNFHMVLIGDGKIFEEIADLVRENGLSNRVIMVGYINPDLVPLYLRASDIYVFPSTQEGFPVVVLEAMAAGLPSVIFKEIYTNEFGNNLLVSGNRAEFINNVEKLVADDNLRNTLSLKAELYAKKFDVAVVGEMWLNLFKEITTNA